MIFFRRNPIIFSFQRCYKSRFAGRKNSGKRHGKNLENLCNFHEKRPHKIDFKGLLKGKPI